MSMSDVGEPNGERRMAALREIPPLMPQFLHRRRAGLPAVREIAGELGVPPPLLFSMIQVGFVAGSYGSEPLTLARICDWEPYTNRKMLLNRVEVLRQHGFLLEDGAGHLALTPQARSAVERLHAAGRAYVAQAKPLPPAKLSQLAATLQRAVQACVADPALSPKPGSHLAASRALATPDDTPMVQIEQAIHDLWMARDDAHRRAWSAAGLEGPAVAVLSQLCLGANTAEEVSAQLAPGLTLPDVESSLEYLVSCDYATQHGDNVQLTPAGLLVREDIERETDRIYFAPWSHTVEEAEWLRDKLRALVANLTSPTP